MQHVILKCHLNGFFYPTQKEKLCRSRLISLPPQNDPYILRDLLRLHHGELCIFLTLTFKLHDAHILYCKS
jgi:hypothetical protein